MIELLLQAGAPLDGKSIFGETAIGTLSRRERFDLVGKLLAAGADPAPLGWTPLMRAIALGTLAEVENEISNHPDLNSTDQIGRTPLHLAVSTGDLQKASLLLKQIELAQTNDPRDQSAIYHTFQRDDTSMLTWLIERGFPIGESDSNGDTTVSQAIENNAAGCMRILLAAGAPFDPTDKEFISEVSDPEIAKILISYGADISAMEPKGLRRFIGLGSNHELEVTEAEYHAGRSRRFGTSNPEQMVIPFWKAMVRCGWSAYQAADLFNDDSYGRDDPVWCHQRLGMSLTILPDGRFIQIAGEHEDYYDPDFCIYNDVFIHDGKGAFKILGYPEEAFPPTDFHSATLVSPWIYIIGNLGYSRTDETPVYRFHIETGAIERVKTSTPSPGYIHSHHAELTANGIRISGGKICHKDKSITERPTSEIWTLDLKSHVWHQEKK